MKHPIEKAAEVAGSEKALADCLGVTKAAVWQWKQPGRKTPIEHCAAIERLCGHAVTRRELRPDDWQAIWPELAEPGGVPASGSVTSQAASPAPGLAGQGAAMPPADCPAADAARSTQVQGGRP
ncbi:transcriptional regulator [Comamonas terrigena]|uniref:transcriptional regulator n=1 Tax=Comamonas terrigena TaxID=32013 RepID=UPI0024499BBE|nr:YdaS family helix-turn-helix protein [Comamonas terrigena]MDH1701003.1 helix-turn-helix domain-containing protein [Comamonas terrigena]